MMAADEDTKNIRDQLTSDARTSEAILIFEGVDKSEEDGFKAVCASRVHLGFLSRGGTYLPSIP